MEKGGFRFQPHSLVSFVFFSFFSSFLFLPRLSRVGWVCQIRLIGRSQNATTPRSQIPQSVLLSIMGHSEGKGGGYKSMGGRGSKRERRLSCVSGRQTDR